MGVSRFDEVEEAVNHTVDVAIEKDVDVYMFLGDLTDPDSDGLTFRSQKLLMQTALRLQRHGIKFIGIAGNHDVSESGDGATVLTPLTALDDDDSAIYIAERPRLIHLAADLAVLCLPFLPTSHGVDQDEVTRALWPKKERVIVISHLSIPGVMPGEETNEMPRGREITYPFEATKNAVLRFNGHYHQRQDFDPGDGGPPIIIPGSLARLTFGQQDHTPSYLHVEV